MNLISAPPTPGQTVKVRMRRWLVEHVDRRRRDDDATLVHLACLEDDAQGEQLAVLWEKEPTLQPPRARHWTCTVATGMLRLGVRTARREAGRQDSAPPAPRSPQKASTESPKSM